MLSRFISDLLLLDCAMPGLNGAEVTRVVKARWPDVPILFMSGHADTAALEAAVGAAPLLRKPFKLKEITTAIRSVLDCSR